MDNIKQEYDITGMSCAACAAHITKAVSKVNGTQDVNVNLLMNKMSVEIKMDQNFKSSKEASEAIEKLLQKQVMVQDLRALRKVLTPMIKIRLQRLMR